jgi:archaemetzincin
MTLTRQQRIAATTSSGTINAKENADSSSADDATFPPPLVLPEDELSLDPKYPPQNFRSWFHGKWRNTLPPERPVGKRRLERRTIYLAAPPDFSPEVAYARKWAQPIAKKTKGTEKVKVEVQDVLDYLKAFYHGLPVKLLPSTPIFTNDVDCMMIDSPEKENSESETLWLNTHTKSGCIGIRSRTRPKGEYSHQLNLTDLLDAAIEILPEDAYAIVMLVDHDIYEDEEDDFACGRAYGGSRVSVISSARYNPVLDQKQEIEREHGWPASHCERYMVWCVDEVDIEETGAERKGEESKSDGKRMTPMQAALTAHNSLPSLARSNPSAASLSALWLARVCRTTAHELGHCFGLDHCVYYACSMQGTASIIEDARQPPYLCPVDLAKVLSATGADVKERYRALLKFCERKSEGQVFKAYGAWIEARLIEMEESERGS